MEPATKTGEVLRIDSHLTAELRTSIEGSVLEPDDEKFAEATLIWNAGAATRPSLVVRAVSRADVIETVRFVVENDLPISIKGGGHNIAGLALVEGGLTLDMSLMRSVMVDSNAKSAIVEPGCTLGDVDRETQKHGLATTLGFVSETGVAGLTLGGGFGYLTRQFGWTVDDLLEVEIVIADGSVLRASRTENEDLFWALRGGGGNFGVVTQFVFKLHEIGPSVTAGIIAWSADDAAGVSDLFRRVTESASRELTIAMLMRNAPPAPWLPEEHHGKPMVAFVVNHTGSSEDAQADLAEVRSYGSPWSDIIQVKAYAAQQAMLDATQPKGMNYYWKSEFLPAVDDDVLATYRRQIEGLKAPANQIVLFHLAGAVNEHAEDDGAVGNRDAGFACVIQAMNPVADNEASQRNRDWVRSAWLALKPFSTGGNYINFQTADEEADRAAESYRENLERLREVKATYDPGNVFRVNRNIVPKMI
jgi:FAD/FMN-containing dehydrogenase